jgi:hypothetical protein
MIPALLFVLANRPNSSPGRECSHLIRQSHSRAKDAARHSSSTPSPPGRAGAWRQPAASGRLGCTGRGRAAGDHAAVPEATGRPCEAAVVVDELDERERIGLEIADAPKERAQAMLHVSEDHHIERACTTVGRRRPDAPRERGVRHGLRAPQLTAHSRRSADGTITSCAARPPQPASASVSTTTTGLTSNAYGAK